MAKSPPKKERKFKVDRVWFIDKSIELTIFVLGFLIALYIDGVRDENEVKQLKGHYMDIISSDLEKDLETYEMAYEHDSLRAEGCDFLLGYLMKRQNAEFHSFGEVKHNTEGRIGPGFDFDTEGQFNQGDTIQIVSEKKGWYLDTSGSWINKQIVKTLSNEFDWFSQEITDSIKKKIESYTVYVDETRSVFQHTTGYDGMMSRNTSSFLSSTTVETKLSDYYSFGKYTNWIEDYYRNNHYPAYNELRHSFGHSSLFQFLYKLNNEQNTELIRQLTLASLHARKEMKYYQKAMSMNRLIQQLIEDRDY